MASVNEWVDAFRLMQVAGVARYYNEPPSSLNSADLPAAWPDMFSAGYNDYQFSCNEQNERFSMDYVIACEAVGQSRLPENYQLMIDMSDAVRDSIVGIDVTLFTRPTRIQPVTRLIAGVAYFCILVTVDGANS